MLPRLHANLIFVITAILIITTYFEFDYQINQSVKKELQAELQASIQFESYIDDLVAFDELKNTRHIPAEVIPLEGEIDVFVIESFYVKKDDFKSIYYTYVTVDYNTGDIYDRQLTTDRMQVI